MSVDEVLNAESRDDVGKGASRRLRRSGRIPAVVYGARRDPVNLIIAQNEIQRHLRDEGFYSQILTLNVAGRPSEQVVLRDLQRHPFKPTVVLHMDLQRVIEDEEIRVRVPLNFINEERCKGVRQDGGIISRLMIEIEVSCLPKDLPESIDVDVLELGVNESILMSELTLPAGGECVHLLQGGSDTTVVSVSYPTGAGSDEDEEAAEGDEQPDESDET